MEYKYLGKSDLKVSKIAFGCMSLDLSLNNQKLINEAIDYGINLFDTADLYDKGENEKAVGRVLRPIRSQICLATKVGNQWRSDGSGWDWNPSKGYIIQAVESSLKRLQTDYIDLYQLHGGTIEDPFDETLEAFEILKNQGKILHYGISSIRLNVIHRWLEGSNMSSIMTQYSLLDRRPEEQHLNWVMQKDVGILARGSLAKGLLALKPPKAYLNWTAPDIKTAQDALSLMSNKRINVHTAIRYVLKQPAITSAVVGIRTIAQLKDVTSVFDSPKLSESEYEYLRTIIGPNHYTDHLV
ncbi:MAG: aldo/keto reductase [Bacteroidota bacterium]